MVRNHLRRFFEIPGKLMYERVHPGSSLGFLLGSAQAGEPLLQGHLDDRFCAFTRAPRKFFNQSDGFGCFDLESHTLPRSMNAGRV
jgi:hypothetical protein